jgi:hypothetical protein
MVQRACYSSMILSSLTWILLRLSCGYWLDMHVTERVVDLLTGAFSDEVADLIGFVAVNGALLLAGAGVFWAIGAGWRKRLHAHEPMKR